MKPYFNIKPSGLTDEKLKQMEVLEACKLIVCRESEDNPGHLNNETYLLTCIECYDKRLIWAQYDDVYSAERRPLCSINTGDTRMDLINYIMNESFRERRKNSTIYSMRQDHRHDNYPVLTASSRATKKYPILEDNHDPKTVSFESNLKKYINNRAKQLYDYQNHKPYKTQTDNPKAELAARSLRALAATLHTLSSDVNEIRKTHKVPKPQDVKFCTCGSEPTSFTRESIHDNKEYLIFCFQCYRFAEGRNRDQALSLWNCECEDVIQEYMAHSEFWSTI